MKRDEIDSVMNMSAVQAVKLECHIPHRKTQFA